MALEKNPVFLTDYWRANQTYPRVVVEAVKRLMVGSVFDHGSTGPCVRVTGNQLAARVRANAMIGWSASRF
jgi:hypothetical protein